MTCMLGAVCGDIAGSIYEFHNIKHKPATLIGHGCRFTDDTVMTLPIEPDHVWIPSSQTH